MAARRLFGSFRKGEANDPETYVAAVLTVLMGYDDAVVNEVCHPARGLAARCDFLPTIKEVRDACEAEAARAARMASYAALPRADFKRLPRPPAGPGAWANQLVKPNSPRYEHIKRQIVGADVRKWKHDEQGRGIWVSWDIWDSMEVRGAKSVKHVQPQPLTDAEIRAKWGNVVADASQPVAQEMAAE